MTEYSQILSATNGAITTITLNRPEKRNALGDTIVRELLDALSEADADTDTKVVVLRGAGTDFVQAQIWRNSNAFHRLGFLIIERCCCRV